MKFNLAAASRLHAKGKTKGAESVTYSGMGIKDVVQAAASNTLIAVRGLNLKQPYNNELLLRSETRWSKSM